MDIYNLKYKYFYTDLTKHAKIENSNILGISKIPNGIFCKSLVLTSEIFLEITFPATD